MNARAPRIRHKWRSSAVVMSTIGPSLLLAFCIVLLLHVRKGVAINCYTCSSRNETDVNCQDPFHPAMSTYTESCMVPKEGHIGQFPANFCIKVIGTTVESGMKLVIRGCTLENMDNQCGVFKFEKDTLQGCILTCDYDGCNGASGLDAFSHIIAMCVITTALIGRLFWNRHEL